MSTIRLEEVARNGEFRLYKRIARNGSSGWAWIHGPAYVLYKGLHLYREFDWESEARVAMSIPVDDNAKRLQAEIDKATKGEAE